MAAMHIGSEAAISGEDGADYSQFAIGQLESGEHEDEENTGDGSPRPESPEKSADEIMRKYR